MLPRRHLWRAHMVSFFKALSLDFGLAQVSRGGGKKKMKPYAKCFQWWNIFHQFASIISKSGGESVDLLGLRRKWRREPRKMTGGEGKKLAQWQNTYREFLLCIITCTEVFSAAGFQLRIICVERVSPSQWLGLSDKVSAITTGKLELSDYWLISRALAYILVVWEKLPAEEPIKKLERGTESRRKERDVNYY